MNLSPFEELDSPLWWVADACAFVVVVGALGAWLWYDAAADTSRLNELVSSSVVSQELADRDLANLRKRFDRLNNRIAQLDGLSKAVAPFKSNLNSTLNALDHIASQRPGTLWVISVSFSNKDDNIVVNGRSFRHEGVARYSKRLALQGYSNQRHQGKILYSRKHRKSRGYEFELTFLNSGRGH